MKIKLMNKITTKSTKPNQKSPKAKKSQKPNRDYYIAPDTMHGFFNYSI